MYKSSTVVFMKITIYTSSDCQFCKAEKDYFNMKGLPFEEKNLENAQSRLLVDSGEVDRIIQEIQESQAVLTEPELRKFFTDRLNTQPRNEAEIRKLLKLAEAKVISLCHQKIQLLGMKVYE